MARVVREEVERQERVRKEEEARLAREEAERRRLEAEEAERLAREAAHRRKVDDGRARFLMRKWCRSYYLDAEAVEDAVALAGMRAYNDQGWPEGQDPVSGI